MTNKAFWITLLTTNAVTILLTCILTDLYQNTKSSISYALGINNAFSKDAISLMIQPEARIPDDHRIIGIGHTHYFTRYLISIVNNGYNGTEKGTVMINSKTANIVGLYIPKLSKAKSIDGVPLSDWRGVGHGNDSNNIVFEMDLPSNNTIVKFYILLESMNGYYDDENLSLDLKYNYGVVSNNSPKVEWKSK